MTKKMRWPPMLPKSFRVCTWQNLVDNSKQQLYHILNQTTIGSVWQLKEAVWIFTFVLLFRAFSSIFTYFCWLSWMFIYIPQKLILIEHVWQYSSTKQPSRKLHHRILITWLLNQTNHAAVRTATLHKDNHMIIEPNKPCCCPDS